MPLIIKPEELEYKTDPASLKDFGLKTLYPRLSIASASKQLIFDIRQLDPDMFSFPYHFHRNSEELMVIISGSLTLRSTDGFTIVNKGELLFFETGESGSHQFYNHENVPCIYLDIRTSFGIDVTEYPDSGKINIWPTREIFEKNTKVDYNKGEENVRKIWEKLKQK